MAGGRRLVRQRDAQTSGTQRRPEGASESGSGADKVAADASGKETSRIEGELTDSDVKTLLVEAASG